MDEHICLVTQPLGTADTTAIREMLEILGSITSVSLVTIALADDAIRERFEVNELDDRIPDQNVLVASIQFIANQIRMSLAIRRREESVILFFGPVAYVLPILVARLSGRRVIVEPRANVPLALQLRWERRMPAAVARFLAGVVWVLERIGYRLAHGVVTYTPGMAMELGLARFEGKLYPTGARFVDTDRFRPLVSFEDRNSVIGYLGRLDEEKGIRTLVQVARRLPKDLTMRFVGGGALRDWMEAQLRDEIEAGTVELDGWVAHDRVPEVLSNFRLLILPSHPAEGLPTTILESFACGTPVYATPVSGVSDVVREGQTGFLMETREPDAIVAGIESAIDGGELPAMSERCRKTVEDGYAFEAAVDRYRMILESITP